MQRKKKVFSANDRLRVRKSYYTFTKEYPQGFVRIERSRRRINKKQIRKALLYTFCFLLLAAVSYFVLSLGVEISYKPIDETQQNQLQSSYTEFLRGNGVKALYVPYNRLGNEKYLKKMVKHVKKKNGNSVVIDFKTREGRLVYSSLHENAVKGKCAVYDNDTVRRALDIFKSAGIAVVARVYCFEDSIVAKTSPEFAVKYMNTDVNWLDGKNENGGNPWLNPYSPQVRNYLADIFSEISAFGVDAFMIESFQFPDGHNTSGATYPGEKNISGRNKVLRSTYAYIESVLPENSLIIFSQSANDAVSGNNNIYFGSMADMPVYAVAVDTRERPQETVVDKKTDFVSVLSMYSAVQTQYQGKKLVPVIDMQEYSYSYIRKMKKAGIDSFILINEAGEY